MRLMKLHPKDKSLSPAYVNPLHLIATGPEDAGSSISVIGIPVAVLIDETTVEVAEEWQRAYQDTLLTDSRSKRDGRTIDELKGQPSQTDQEILDHRKEISRLEDLVREKHGVFIPTHAQQVRTVIETLARHCRIGGWTAVADALEDSIGRVQHAIGLYPRTK